MLSSTNPGAPSAWEGEVWAMEKTGGECTGKDLAVAKSLLPRGRAEMSRRPEVGCTPLLFGSAVFLRVPPFSLSVGLLIQNTVADAIFLPAECGPDSQSPVSLSPLRAALHPSPGTTLSTKGSPLHGPQIPRS